MSELIICCRDGVQRGSPGEPLPAGAHPAPAPRGLGSQPPAAADGGDPRHPDRAHVRGRGEAREAGRDPGEGGEGGDQPGQQRGQQRGQRGVCGPGGQVSTRCGGDMSRDMRVLQVPE